MKTPAKKMPTLIPPKMRAGILKRLVTLTALGAPKKVERVRASFSPSGLQVTKLKDAAPPN